ncbi:MAG TPA: DUF3817 domain-containing protein [Actinomycetes bacterium]|nr:DUF3817 domain-containing protein [Actinomycetes bacterium]
MNGALIRYRVMAWIVGVMLLVVVAATLVKYLGDNPTLIETVGPIHGFLYVVYLIATVDLAMRLRWSPAKTVGICLAGTIPFLSFVAEHRVNQQVSGVIAAADGGAKAEPTSSGAP